MIDITDENRFELYEAMHCYATLNHSGQSSELYLVLSQSEFKPGALWSESRVIKDNPYYAELDDNNCLELARQFGIEV